MILSELAPLVSAQHGVFYTMTSPATTAAKQCWSCRPATATRSASTSRRRSASGQGLVGQCAKEKKRILLTEVPGDYVRINSGLGEAPPLNIIVLPVLFEGSVRAVVELASFSPFSLTHQAFLDSITESIGLVLTTIEANILTETPAQAVPVPGRGAALPARGAARGPTRTSPARRRCSRTRTSEAEQKNLEVEASSRLVEEKVSQLAVSSRYKSEFIANMSHELRTPLNSLLILAQQLEDNPDRNLTDTQVEYASVIHASGNELLELLNSILDLAKVESGTVTPAHDEVSLENLRVALLREFDPVAQTRDFGYTFELAPGTPTSMVTDPQRLRQILKNLLANAFKFTDSGSVHVSVGLTDGGWDPRAGLIDGSTLGDGLLGP